MQTSLLEFVILLVLRGKRMRRTGELWFALKDARVVIHPKYGYRITPAQIDEAITKLCAAGILVEEDGFLRWSDAFHRDFKDDPLLPYIAASTTEMCANWPAIPPPNDIPPTPPAASAASAA